MVPSHFREHCIAYLQLRPDTGGPGERAQFGRANERLTRERVFPSGSAQIEK